MKERAEVTGACVLVLVLMLAVLFSAPGLGGVDNGALMRCLRACTNDCTMCLHGCDVLDQSCWDYCYQLLTICASTCPGIGGVGIPH